MSKNKSSVAISIIKGVLVLQVIGVIWLLFFSEFNQENKSTAQTSSPILGGDKPGSLGDIKKQLALEKKRVAEMIELQQEKINRVELTAANDVSQQQSEIEAVMAQNLVLRQKLKEMSTSTQGLLDELKQNTNAKTSAEDQSFLKALEMVPGDASETISAPAVPSDSAESINRVVLASSDNVQSSLASISSRVSELMQTSDKASKDPTSNTNLVVATKGAQNNDSATTLDSLQTRIDNLLEQNTAKASAPTTSVDNTAYLKSLAPLEKERTNETRWVTVIAGDTLFVIAERAYSDGSLYPKIFDANPQVLTNPDLIRVGQRLRVPL